ncbi:MAG TPA: NAD-dependent epimerase/dehydratase family protein, partial [Flavobacteriales bacterium]|nr:NAD-dependent epimerase/dehydratase family protein [Flavobacteriales bacterium]
NWTILRPTGIYGNNYYWRSLIQEFKTKKNIKIIGPGSWPLQYIYVEDCARAIVDVLNTDITKRNTYTICSADHLDYNAYLAAMQLATNTKLSVRHIPMWATELYVSTVGVIQPQLKTKLANIHRMYNAQFHDSSKAIKDFGFLSRPFSQGLKDLIGETETNEA